ncbi:MAG: cobalamin biosynthesis protein CobD [Saccharospirillaceae bacterium]|nr:adenosylcobinamide-phosphate synthase CbiB [Pseudomonadales bacterium]NRB80061.1 cobalamin biosynthesis protein CobD [Saccharospirillaceae bacterium]
MILYLLIALVIDKTFGELKIYHPLVGFGNCVNWIEKKLNKHKFQTTFTTNGKNSFKNRIKTRITGLIAHACITIPFIVLFYVVLTLINQSTVLTIVAGLILYFCIGWNSLLLHAKNIIIPLKNNDISKARMEIGKIVSRDTTQLDETAISKATIESVLENGADAIFSAIFWFVITGFILGLEAACVMCIYYRMSNTLDAMWGYKTDRYLYFGWFAARMDDVLNFIPARLTAISYALMGNFNGALKYWKQQGNNWKSPNAGPVMASGAGAINVSLGGGAVYNGNWQERDILGPAENTQTIAKSDKILDACKLVTRCVFLWVTLIFIIDLYAFLNGQNF